MVNKPQALYREDAHRAFNHDRQLLINELCQEDATYDRRLSSTAPLGPAGTDLVGLLRSRHAASENEAFRQEYNLLLDHTLRTQDRTTALAQHHTHHGRPSEIPRVLYAVLNTGFEFRCLVSTTDRGSFISETLFHQIRPRPDLSSPGPPGSVVGGERLRFNGRIFRSSGIVSFAMKMTTTSEDEGKLVEVVVTANVVPGLYPDLFLGRESSGGQALLHSTHSSALQQTG